MDPLSLKHHWDSPLSYCAINTLSQHICESGSCAATWNNHFITGVISSCFKGCLRPFRPPESLFAQEMLPCRCLKGMVSLSGWCWSLLWGRYLTLKKVVDGMDVLCALCEQICACTKGKILDFSDVVADPGKLYGTQWIYWSFTLMYDRHSSCIGQRGSHLWPNFLLYHLSTKV